MKHLYLLLAITAFSNLYSQQNVDGQLDLSFNQIGYVITDLNDTNDLSYASAVQADGKILVGGSTLIVNQTKIAIVRYNTDGSLDATFGINGVKSFDPEAPGIYSCIRAIKLTDDGKILIAGFSGSKILLARLNSNGNIDQSFGSNGLTFTLNPVNAAWTNQINDIKVTDEGKIIAVGQQYASNTGTIRMVIARYNANGTLDSTFAGNGYFSVPSIYNDDRAQEVAIQPDGKIVVAGFAGSSGSAMDHDFVLLRFNADGTFDNTFATEGKLVLDVTSNLYRDECYALAIMPNGNIVATGAYSYSSCTTFTAIMVTPSGVLDNSFANDGVYIGTHLTNFCGRSVIIQKGDKILISGNGSRESTATDYTIIRLLPSGTPDLTFGNTDSLFITDILQAGNLVSQMCMLPDGNLIIAGHTIFPLGNPYYHGVDFSVARVTCTDCLPENAQQTTIKETGVFTNISLYPNPSSGNFNLSLKAEKQADATIKLLSITGAKVFEQKVNIGKGDNLIPIQTNVAKGFYILRLISKELNSTLKISIE